MGSWDETCALSGLAIPPGTEVRILYLYKTQSPMSEGYHPTSHYGVVTPISIRGVYDDYGRVRPLGTDDLVPISELPKSAENRLYVFQQEVLVHKCVVNPTEPEAVDPASLLDPYAFYDGVQSGDIELSTCKDSAALEHAYGVLIREDVWQTYLRLNARILKEDESLAAYYPDLDSLTKAFYDVVNTPEKFEYPYQYIQLLHNKYKSYSGTDMPDWKMDNSLSMFGFAGSMDLFYGSIWRNLLKSLYPQSTKEKPVFPVSTEHHKTMPFLRLFCARALEIRAVHNVMYATRQAFALPMGKGSQHHEWKTKAALLNALARIATKEQKQLEEEWDE